MLDTKAKETFINNVVIPSITGLLTAPIDITLYDTNGKVITASDLAVHNLGLSKKEEILGLSYKDADSKLIKSLCSTIEEDLDDLLRMAQKIHKLQQISITKKIALSYVDIIPYNNSFEAMLINNLPICAPNGEVVALQATATKYKLFGIYDYLKQMYNSIEKTYEYKITKGSQLPIKLSKREHEILFILMAGISQYEAAQFLNITRGTVSKLLTDKLCPKFGVHGSNTKLLVEKAKKLQLDKFMPASFFRPKVIIMDTSIIEEYFNEL
ncbi:helix-turn-helix transcriptional regulator [Aquella oligotrophica]|uniref:HTH luxR-type domain-containing protein n=1 Tax=Aquella oligotrophica TaxID=2067065 RepID=A0A2I7N5F8_9NEIS|nr:hypothetical protein [Aquella oligotrophica]AUR51697.1 hypothetical protein CUN60_05110 [Aquella oligotrophica]